MKKYNVCLPKKFKQGEEEKTFWAPVGKITEFDNGGRILELNILPYTYQIFPMEDKDNRSSEEIKKEYTKTPELKLDIMPEVEVKLDSEPAPF